MVAAKRRGQKLGRQFALTPDQVQNLKQMVKQGMTVAQVGRTMRLHRATVYRYLQAA